MSREPERALRYAVAMLHKLNPGCRRSGARLAFLLLINLTPAWAQPPGTEALYAGR